MKKLLSAVAAIIVTSVAALAANIPLITTPTDPSQIVSIFNGILNAMNVGGVNTGPTIYGVPTGFLNITPVPTATGTGAQNLYTWTIPANYMATVRGIRFRCAGTKAANVDNVTTQIIFGGQAVANPPLSAASAAPWVLEASVYRTGVNAQTSYGISSFGAVQTANVQTTTVTDTAAISVTCTVTDGTSAAADATLQAASAEVIQ